MSQTLDVLYRSKPCYSIVFESSFQELPSYLEPLDCQSRKICVITDNHVNELYGEEIEKIIAPACLEIYRYAFSSGEASKTLTTVKNIYSYLIEHRFTRQDILIALGGGVVGDITGFTAATYLRGIDFVQIPTTLLAQADSSIGGKTGVDFDGYKNMVGAFHMPKLVYMNIQTLSTLPDREFYSGFAEVMKAALIKNSSFYEWLIDHMYEICDRDTEILKEMLYQSCMIKKLVVEKDPTEQGERALLNFGHTIGHAIEKNQNFTLTHGECVALGCVAAAYISWKKNWLSMDEYYEIRDMFVPFQLPISIDHLDVEEVLRLTKSDKKSEGSTIKFILLKKVGKAVIDRSVTDDEIRDAIREINFSDEDAAS